MIHHPLILVLKLVMIGIVVSALIFLHGILNPTQFSFAVVGGIFILLAGNIAIWILTARALSNPDSKWGRETVLSAELGSDAGYRASHDEYNRLIGKRGIALSNLNPAGNVTIDGERFAVMTDGEFVDKDTGVEVVEARGARIVVTACPGDSGSEPETAG